VSTSGGRRRARGGIDLLPSGAYRVRVYAGLDPLTGKRNYLTEVVPSGPKAASEAEKLRTRLLSQVDERRNPRTKATVNQLLDRYLEVVDLDDSTRSTYVGYLDRHVRPVLGNLLLSKVDGEMLDTLYGQLRRCRARCNGRSRAIEHRTKVAHQCDERCRPHVCRPMAALFGLSAALFVDERDINRGASEKTGAHRRPRLHSLIRGAVAASAVASRGSRAACAALPAWSVGGGWQTGG
jgi:integrase